MAIEGDARLNPETFPKKCQNVSDHHSILTIVQECDSDFRSDITSIILSESNQSNIAGTSVGGVWHAPRSRFYTWDSESICFSA